MIAGYNKRIVKVTCEHCSSVHVLEVNPEDIIRWQSGVFIQDCMPYLSDAEREERSLYFAQVCGGITQEL